VEHEFCFGVDLAAGPGEVEARGKLEGGSDGEVVHVDAAAVCEGEREWLVKVQRMVRGGEWIWMLG
jgi:hypothetical protein